MRHFKRQLALFGLLTVSIFYSGLPSLAADRQLQIAPVQPAPGGERRLALIIGNSSYKTSPLRNPVNDARSIGKALSATGFRRNGRALPKANAVEVLSGGRSPSFRFREEQELDILASCRGLCRDFRNA